MPESMGPNGKAAGAVGECSGGSPVERLVAGNGNYRLLVAEPEKRKDIPVGIRDLEPPQPIVDERQLFHERRAPLSELAEKHVGVHSVDVRIPTSPCVSGVVWTRKHVG